jgi:hypothetical protein
MFVISVYDGYKNVMFAIGSTVCLVLEPSTVEGQSFGVAA